jgi:peroxiredoxin
MTLGIVRVGACTGLLLSALHCGGSGNGAVGKSSVVGEAPIRFALTGLDGAKISSDSVRGKPYVLVFFTTWDVASQAQMIALSKYCSGATIAKSAHPCKSSVAAVALDDAQNRELVEAFAETMKLPFPVATATLLEARALLGEGLGVPTTLVVDSLGRVAHLERAAMAPQALFGILANLHEKDGR